MKGKNQSSAQVVDESIKFYTPDEPEEKKVRIIFSIFTDLIIFYNIAFNRGYN